MIENSSQETDIFIKVYKSYILMYYVPKSNCILLVQQRGYNLTFTLSDIVLHLVLRETL